MDQKELDDAYDQSVYAPNRDQVHERNELNSDRVRARPRRAEARGLRADARSSSSTLFATKRPNAPINVFIHGGAWRAALGQGLRLPRRAVRQRRRAFHRRSTSTASRQTNGDLHADGRSGAARGRLGLQERHRASAAIPTASMSPASRPARISAACVVITDWEELRRARRRREGRAALLAACTTSSRCGCRSARAMSTSPTRWSRRCRSQRHLDRLNCPVIVAYGTYETPEFQRQARDFAAAVKAAGKPVSSWSREGYNHFEMPRDARQSLRAARPRGAGADEADNA